jgi:phosphoglycerol transferase MdoB-like AlkP superfamily enzyme
MIAHSSMGGGISASDFFNVLYHGLPLDLSTSGYLTALPALILIASIVFKPSIISKIYNVYFALILAVVSIIAIVDIVVYPYWSFHFDSTVFLYLKNPKEAFASASVLEIVLGTLGIIAFFAATYAGYIYLIKKQVLRLKVPKSRAVTSIVLLLLTAFLFLPIRGGITVSTMNVGKVYFSDNLFLNHAAINPQFNLLYSISKSDNFGSQYQFYDKTEATAIFDDLTSQPVADSIPRLLNTDRPNIILFILESFSADVSADSIIAPNIYQFAKEGIAFKNFYANSFRTDRGLVSILSGYPGHPTVAIMKYPQKTESLPTIPKTLKNSGYKNLSLFYGGDADFSNMRSYFVGACSINNIVSDSDFPLSERMTKWGVPDSLLIDRAYSDIVEAEQEAPFFKVILTLSSHEPFDVPTAKFDIPFLNAINYTDENLVFFVSKLKQTKLWDNTLIILIADHAMQSYPQGVNNNDAKRFEIPMIWLGGAVKEPYTIIDYGSQNDLAATLLSQLNMKYNDFRFSKDILNPEAHKFAFYSYMNGFSMIDSTGMITYDNDKQGIINQSGNPDLEKQAKAFFQMMYIDLGNR